MNLNKIITAVCSILFLMLGADKFLNFLEPPCSLMNQVPTAVWTTLGVVYPLAGILIWLPKFRRPIAGVFLVLMVGFSIYHLTQNTYDIGGSSFMAVLLALLLWNPGFMRGKQSLETQ